MRPRIVKLHASFPAQRPFVVTEEDFRTYPTRRAPFVTFVTESLMGHAPIPIGFSGGDPNFLFLAWSGWARDELGPPAPASYPCGVLRLAAPRRRLLGRRGVIPIDRRSLFPLLYGAPPCTVHWPTPRVSDIEIASGDLALVYPSFILHPAPMTRHRPTPCHTGAAVWAGVLTSRRVASYRSQASSTGSYRPDG